MKKFYVAFSIHSTSAFAVATIETDTFVMSADRTTVTINGREFIVAKSRRPDYDEAKDGIKLHNKALSTKEGKPMRSTPMIVRFFNTLQREGWTVDKAAFVRKHWK